MKNNKARLAVLKFQHSTFMKNQMNPLHIERFIFKK